MKAVSPNAAMVTIVLSTLLGCTEVDVGERSEAIAVETGGPMRVELPDAGPLVTVATNVESAFPAEHAYVDAGRDAECHDACPARCDDDEICCYTTGMCVPLDCWECCPDMDSRSRHIGHASGQDP